MHASDHDDDDASGTFWPGYVDAVTNLVLNLLFLLTVMTVAVFMFALELGKSMQGGGKSPVATAQADKKADEKPPSEAQLKELQKRIEQLQQELAAAKQQNRASIVDATALAPKAPKGLDKTIQADADVIVRFIDDAVTLKPDEVTKLRELLAPVVAKGGARLDVEVPKGFTEAKRMGFYRAMAVRNLLLEMKMPQNRIDLTVREGKITANASLVKVYAKTK